MLCSLTLANQLKTKTNYRTSSVKVEFRQSIPLLRKCKTTKNENLAVTRARGYKTFFVLSSVEHEISNAHKYKNIKKFGFFQAQISGEGYFSCS